MHLHQPPPRRWPRRRRNGLPGPSGRVTAALRSPHRRHSRRGSQPTRGGSQPTVAGCVRRARCSMRRRARSARWSAAECGQKAPRGPRVINSGSSRGPTPSPALSRSGPAGSMCPPRTGPDLASCASGLRARLVALGSSTLAGGEDGPLGAYPPPWVLERVVYNVADLTACLWPSRWSCISCTFCNPKASSHCDACGTWRYHRPLP